MVNDKPLVWLQGEVKTPPFSPKARLDAGGLLRRLQRGETLGLPHSRPMPIIAPGCHELRLRDGGHNWRIMYNVSEDVILVLDVFSKKTSETPNAVINDCRRRVKSFNRLTEGKGF
jgi:phage-related protein